MKFVRIVDENGLFISDEFVDELTEFTIETPCPAGFYLPKWDGEKWVEGGEKPEPQPIELTEIEKIKLRQDATEDALLFLMDMGGML